jgi:hypothetical protein
VMFHRGHHNAGAGQLRMPGSLLESTGGSVLESAEGPWLRCPGKAQSVVYFRLRGLLRTWFYLWISSRSMAIRGGRDSLDSGGSETMAEYEMKDQRVAAYAFW